MKNSTIFIFLVFTILAASCTKQEPFIITQDENVGVTELRPENYVGSIAKNFHFIVGDTYTFDYEGVDLWVVYNEDGLIDTLEGQRVEYQWAFNTETYVMGWDYQTGDYVKDTFAIYQRLDWDNEDMTYRYGASNMKESDVCLVTWKGWDIYVPSIVRLNTWSNKEGRFAETLDMLSVGVENSLPEHMWSLLKKYPQLILAEDTKPISGRDIRTSKPKVSGWLYRSFSWERYRWMKDSGYNVKNTEKTPVIMYNIWWKITPDLVVHESVHAYEFAWVNNMMNNSEVRDSLWRTTVNAYREVASTWRRTSGMVHASRNTSEFIAEIITWELANRREGKYQDFVNMFNDDIKNVLDMYLDTGLYQYGEHDPSYYANTVQVRSFGKSFNFETETICDHNH